LLPFQLIQNNKTVQRWIISHI